MPLTLEALAGVPVIATSTGTIASRLPVVQNWATVFSPDGDTIFVAGRRGFGPGDAQQLMAVSTSSGAVAAQMADSVPFLEDLVLDPEGPWLYAVESNGPTIHIYDRSSLRHLLSFQPPAASSCGPYCGLQVGLAIDPSTRRLYVLGTKSWGEDFYRGPSDIFTFELLPTIQVPQILTP